MLSSEKVRWYSRCSVHVSKTMLQQITMSAFLPNRMLRQVTAVLRLNITSYTQHAVMLPYK